MHVHIAGGDERKIALKSQCGECREPRAVAAIAGEFHCQPDVAWKILA